MTQLIMLITNLQAIGVNPADFHVGHRFHELIIELYLTNETASFNFPH